MRIPGAERRRTNFENVDSFFEDRMGDFSSQPNTDSILNTIRYFIQSISPGEVFCFNSTNIETLYEYIKKELLENSEAYQTDSRDVSIPVLFRRFIGHKKNKNKKPSTQEILQCLIVLNGFIDQDKTESPADSLFNELDKLDRGDEYITAAMRSTMIIVDATSIDTEAKNKISVDMTIVKGIGHPATYGEIGMLVNNIRYDTISINDWNILKKYVLGETQGRSGNNTFRKLIIERLYRSVATIGPTLMTDSGIFTREDLKSFANIDGDYNRLFTELRISICTVPVSDEYLEEGETHDLDQYVANLLNSNRPASVEYGFNIIFGETLNMELLNDYLNRVGTKLGEISVIDVQNLRSLPESFDILYYELNRQIFLLDIKAIYRKIMPKTIRRLFEVLGFSSDQAREIFLRWETDAIQVNLREYQKLLNSDYVLVEKPIVDNEVGNNNATTVIKGIDDNNAAFNTRETDPNSRVYRAKNVNGVKQILQNILADFKINEEPVGTIVLGGHGNVSWIKIGVDNNDSINIEDGSADEISMLLKEMGSPDLILESCSSNKQTVDGSENIAHYIARKSGCRVYAPIDDSTRHVKDSKGNIWFGYWNGNEVLIDVITGEEYIGPTHFTRAEPLVVNDVD